MTKSIRIVNRINAYCKVDRHDECPAISGLTILTRENKVIFVCSCECHKEKIKLNVEQKVND